ncbi:MULTISPECIES: N-acetyltransferase [Paraliobacillus]|uniref:GNAT family N-acetyltransferase n=1 Tax=Paraliobacillus TaxID=200903 RepID=UPI000DD39823|nr:MULTISPECIES: GNAT family N-acetyltransferase [Paraliobacillus]
MIQLATEKDLEGIMLVVKSVVKMMNEQGSFQWNDTYPLVTDYQKDLRREELYIYKESELILGVCTISKRGHEEYDEIAWSQHDHALTVKRLAVDPNARGKGLADNFFQFAEKVAKKHNANHLTTDTYAENQYAQKLFKRNGFRFVQARREEKEAAELYYFEKALK